MYKALFEEVEQVSSKTPSLVSINFPDLDIGKENRARRVITTAKDLHRVYVVLGVLYAKRKRNKGAVTAISRCTLSVRVDVKSFCTLRVSRQASAAMKNAFLSIDCCARSIVVRELLLLLVSEIHNRLKTLHNLQLVCVAQIIEIEQRVTKNVSVSSTALSTSLQNLL